VSGLLQLQDTGKWSLDEVAEGALAGGAGEGSLICLGRDSFRGPEFGPSLALRRTLREGRKCVTASWSESPCSLLRVHVAFPSMRFTHPSGRGLIALMLASRVLLEQSADDAARIAMLPLRSCPLIARAT